MVLGRCGLRVWVIIGLGLKEQNMETFDGEIPVTQY